MSAMHHDTSADLSVIGSKIKDILEVLVFISLISVIFIWINSVQLPLSSYLMDDCNLYLQIPTLSLKKRKVIHDLCRIVATRGARLAAAGILGILKMVGRDTLLSCNEKQKSVVAMDGGLYEHYTEFRECLEETLKELVGDKVWEHISIEHANDGSGIGASLLAASHSRYLEPEVKESQDDIVVVPSMLSED